MCMALLADLRDGRGFLDNLRYIAIEFLEVKRLLTAEFAHLLSRMKMPQVSGPSNSSVKT